MLTPSVCNCLPLVVTAPACVLAGAKAWAEELFTDKTLVVWTSPDNPALRGDSALTIEKTGGIIDGIVFGEIAEGRREVLDNLATLGKGGGYIIAPCHNIQSIAPPENVLAMHETGYAEGWA